MTTPALICLTGLVLFSSCKKKENLPESNPDIIYGEGSSVTIVPQNNGMQVDVDGDGSADIQLKRDQLKVMGPLYHALYTIVPLNKNLRFKGTYRKDSLFSATISSTISQKDNQDHQQVYKISEEITSCNNNFTGAVLDSMASLRFKVSLFDAGQIIDADHFESSSSRVFEEPYSIIIDQKGSFPDTCFMSKKTYKNDCDANFQNPTKYIAFELPDASGLRRGWIRLNKKSDAISIDEVAISKAAIK